jgi:Protein of unknown function (DUF732)
MNSHGREDSRMSLVSAVHVFAAGKLADLVILDGRSHRSAIGHPGSRDVQGGAQRLLRVTTTALRIRLASRVRLSAMNIHRLGIRAATALTVGAAGLAAFAGIATASATSTDDAYLSEISNAGITYDSPQGAIRVAHSLCQAFSADSTNNTAIQVLKNTGLGQHYQDVLAVAAVHAYCPQFSGQVVF